MIVLKEKSFMKENVCSISKVCLFVWVSAPLVDFTFPVYFHVYVQEGFPVEWE